MKAREERKSWVTTPVDRLQAKSPDLPAVFSYGFRPFFLCAALTAAVSVPLWLAMLATGVEPAGPLPALSWHPHEMIFGYVAAVIAGFTLTAVPNWTGRLPVTGWPLVGLLSLWLAGRLAMAFVPLTGLAAVLDLAFLFVLAGVVWREILAGRNFRNLPVATLITLFAAANLLFHLQTKWPALAGYGERLALAVAGLLIGLIGGRITPSFTRNWMAKLSLDPLPAPFGAFDKLTVLTTACGLAFWVGFPDARTAGAFLIVGSLVNLVRLTRWRGLSTTREPIVLILHVGYLWLVVALFLLGFSALVPDLVPSSVALHALTTGAIGTMTLAVMTRTSLGHTGRPISADGATLAIYVLVTLGAVLRVGAPAIPAFYLEALMISGSLWSAAFGLFVIAYAPILLKPGSGRI